jgi:hypothetical protein
MKTNQHDCPKAIAVDSAPAPLEHADPEAVRRLHTTFRIVMAAFFILVLLTFARG